MFYIRLCDALNCNGIRYLVVGGMAVNLHGVTRLTMDIDLAVDASVDQSAAWERACAELGLSPRQPVTWAQMYSTEERHRLREEKNLIAFGLLSQRDEDPAVDILFEPSATFEPAYKRVRLIELEGVQIPVIAVRDLIKMKAMAGRARDLADIVQLTDHL